jgi:hypothetical protein
MKYLETEEEKIICNHIISYFCDSICFVLLLRLTSLDPLLKMELHKLLNDGVWVWQRSTDRTIQSAPIATAAKQAAASNQDILSQDIEEAVVINKPKNTTFKRNGEGRG